MILPSITLLYGGALALWFLALSFRVIQGRSAPDAPGVGDGNNAALLRRIRGHANFSEYVPLILLLTAMLELSGTSSWIIHALGMALLIGRILHGIALSYTEKFVFGRKFGIALTLLALLLSGLLAALTGIQAL